MSRKASGNPKVKRVERLQSNGDIYIYEVTTRYNPEKRYNEHVSSKLLGKKSPDGSIARFWMANPDKPIRRIEEWQISHTLPYREGLSEDTCYSLMKDLGQDISVSQKYFQYHSIMMPT